jgi:hypothetical protein
VSTARYRPELDAKQEIDREHVWPASHCGRYVGRFFTNKTPAGPPPDKKHCHNTLEYHPGSAVAAAVVAHNELPSPSTPAELSNLWLGRICKTASHELGHCFGLVLSMTWCLTQYQLAIIHLFRLLTSAELFVGSTIARTGLAQCKELPVYLKTIVNRRTRVPWI